MDLMNILRQGKSRTNLIKRVVMDRLQNIKLEFDSLDNTSFGNNEEDKVIEKALERFSLAILRNNNIYEYEFKYYPGYGYKTIKKLHKCESLKDTLKTIISFYDVKIQKHIEDNVIINIDNLILEELQYERGVLVRFYKKL